MELTIYTIGHSNYTVEFFVEQLKKHGIDRLVDVRSIPSSKYIPHFNRPELAYKVEDEGIEYIWLGDKLGGFRKDLQNEHGMRDDKKFDADEKYREGIEKLLRLASNRTVAIMCSEEDPLKCHRHDIIAQTLINKRIPVCEEFDRIDVKHIRGNGEIEDARVITGGNQMLLF